jgi:hypothetical protein
LTRDESRKGPISADSLFFILLLIPHFFRFPELNYTAFPYGVWTWLEPYIPKPTPSLPHPINHLVASFLMLLVIFYLFADAWGLATGRLQERISRLKITLVLCAFSVIILFPAFHEISLRIALGPETHAHDGVIQVEEAIKKTLHLRNVYTDNFYGTPVENSGFANPQTWQRLGIRTYPALEHFIYLPLTFLIPLPFYLAMNTTVGWFDLRLILIPAYVLFIWFSHEIAKGAHRKILAVQFAALNPYLATFLIEGRNDAIPLALLGGALYLMEHRPTWAQVLLASACLSKQYAWLTVPFFGLFLIRESRQKSFIRSAGQSIAALWPFWLVFVGGMLPYFIWGPSAFLKSVVLGGSDILPIKGIDAYGFGTWVLYFGWAKDAASDFPFLAIQLVFTLPVLIVCSIWQMRKNAVSQLILGGTLVICVFFYFSRYFHNSYFGIVIALLALAYCTGGPEENGLPASP